MSQKIIIGLGNPGPSYADTRHNAGFMALSLFSAVYRLGSSTTIKGSAIVEGDILRHRVILAWPLNFMDHMGRSAKDLLDHFKIESLDNVLVLHDDMFLPLAQIKIERGGDFYQHDGLLSLKETLGTNFTRIRIGIGSPPEEPDPQETEETYTSLPFDFDELEFFRPALKITTETAFLWATQGLEIAEAFLHSNNNP
ncbi:MAG: aminoacyl-tRNA hydrolase [Deltaproteobacteria bacterium]|jgi:PTH1 family peptidyl-tRNA hydrolase|nr:aminoacyl-tRNA hydrolase [Deltaproteobacteria bacterium]